LSTATLSRFFAALTLLTFAGTVAVVALMIVARAKPQGGAAALLADVERNALWLGWLVAAVTTAGSLYYSLGAHFTPCELCWYQRICVYPLSVVLLIAAIRRDHSVWRYAVPPTLIGIAIAAYHSQLQAWPTQQTFCSATVPCTTRYVWEFGFVSLPLMDLAALLFVAAMLALVRSSEVLEREGVR
jgi:disulfide bond formation protein DsbB